MSHTMTKAEREAFLAEVHVGVVAISEPGHGPLAVPVWYDYEPGGPVWFVTPRESRKGPLVEVGKRISLCVQTEERPYKYVSIEGPVISAEIADIDEHMRPMAQATWARPRAVTMPRTNARPSKAAPASSSWSAPSAGSASITARIRPAALRP